MYKLLALDIDDTITKEASRVPEGNAAAIKRAQDAGVYVTVATGRGFLGSSCIWRQLNIEGPVINYGGALINDTRTGESIYSTSIPPALVTQVLCHANRLGIHAHIYQGDGIVCAEESFYSRRYISKLGLACAIDPEIRQKRWENVPKVLWITEAERADELIPELIRQYGGRLKVSGSVPGFIEFNDPTAHKGSALAWLAVRLGVRREEVAAIGDNLLDIEMIQWAGLGAAVGDAHRAVIEAADVILPSCEALGAAWLIDNVILKGR